MSTSRDNLKMLMRRDPNDYQGGSHNQKQNYNNSSTSIMNSSRNNNSLDSSIRNGSHQEVINNKIKCMLNSLIRDTRTDQHNNNYISPKRQTNRSDRSAEKTEDSIKKISHEVTKRLLNTTNNFRNQTPEQNQPRNSQRSELYFAQKITSPDRNLKVSLIRDQDKSMIESAITELEQNYQKLNPRKQFNVSTTPKSNKIVQSLENNSRLQSSTQSTQVSEDNQAFTIIQKLCLQKDDILQQLNKYCLSKVCFQQLQNHLEKYLKIVIELSNKTNEKFWSKFDQSILQNLYIDLLVIYVLIVEVRMNTSQIIHLEINLKNLVQYSSLSSIYVLDKLIECKIGKQNSELMKRMQQRVIDGIKRKGRDNKTRCQLSKNNDIVHSLASMMQQYMNRFINNRIEDSEYGEAYIKINLKGYQIPQILQLIKPLYGELNVRNESEMTFPSISNDLDQPKHPKQPYLGPNISNGKQYTLVLDLDETLVHYQEFEKGGGQFLVRPFAQEFLIETSKYFEVVIFTAALPDYANFILDIIDKQKNISYRLYREHTVHLSNVYIKDLSLLGRSLCNTIIVDNMPENFKLQPENGIFIRSWMGELNDRALKDLLPLLKGNIILIEYIKRNCIKEMQRCAFGSKIIQGVNAQQNIKWMQGSLFQSQIITKYLNFL